MGDSMNKEWVDKWIGKTISSFEVIKAEYGRTFPYYICFTFADGTKQILSSFFDGEGYNLRPPLEEMKKARKFFSAEDISNRVLQDEKRSRQNEKESLENKKRQLEQLKKELGEG
jgi:hypothetical protein